MSYTRSQFEIILEAVKKTLAKDAGKKESNKNTVDDLQEAENVAESYDRKRMAELSDEFSKLTKEMNSVLEKHGVKKGQLLTITQLNAIKAKMTPEDKKKYEGAAEKAKKNQSETAKMSNAPKPTEKYPLGGRDEKSARSYSS